MNDLYLYLIFVPVSYIIGSINFATIIAKIKNKDIKKMGSGNPGTMNMLRSVGKFWGCLTFVLDCAKGISFALIGMFVFKNSNLAMHVLGLSVVLGHIFSCFSKFKGGKGVATSLGEVAGGGICSYNPYCFCGSFYLDDNLFGFFQKRFYRVIVRNQRFGYYQYSSQQHSKAGILLYLFGFACGLVGFDFLDTQSKFQKDKKQYGKLTIFVRQRE